ncbi:MAG TPA: hypothetical protein VMB50_02500, partial [Myxococcales bacterium]|nr:hypothetical protein [Myxococcales bacterium]
MKRPLLATLALLGGCTVASYPPGVLTCGSDPACPDGMTCGCDGLCWPASGLPTCDAGNSSTGGNAASTGSSGGSTGGKGAGGSTTGGGASSGGSTGGPTGGCESYRDCLVFQSCVDGGCAPTGCNVPLLACTPGNGIANGGTCVPEPTDAGLSGLCVPAGT